jgi:two-component system, NarL family, nitrate/nitrite response regulator NarL
MAAVLPLAFSRQNIISRFAIADPYSMPSRASRSGRRTLFCWILIHITQTGSLFLARAQAAGFHGKTLQLTAGIHELAAAALIGRGISGIVPKQSSQEELSDSIREVLAGKVCFDQAYLQRAMEVASTFENSMRHSRIFTERERQVLSLVFDGLANKEIAGRLSITESSVKAALQQLSSKTGVRTRSQLVKIALEQYKDQFF